MGQVQELIYSLSIGLKIEKLSTRFLFTYTYKPVMLDKDDFEFAQVYLYYAYVVQSDKLKTWPLQSRLSTRLLCFDYKIFPLYVFETSRLRDKHKVKDF